MSILRLFIFLLFSLLVIVSGFAAGFGVNYYQTQLAAPSAVAVPAKFNLTWEAWGILKREFYGAIPGTAQLVHGMIRGMLVALNDPYTVLIEPQPAQLQQNSLQGSYGGIGAQVEFKNGLYVLLPFPNSPAERAGIKANDVLLRIDATDILPNMTIDDIEIKLRGDIGNKVKLSITRVGLTERSLAIEVVREKIDIPTVQYRMLENTNLAYVQVTMESSETAKQMSDALRSLMKENPKGIVLDLRNNPGGLFPDPVLDITGQFLKDGGVVVYERYRDGNDKEYRATNGKLAADLPLAILVNAGTASAAEVIAGALSDYGRGPLIGEKTFGKGSVQQVNALTDKSSLHVTVATWLTPKKNLIDGTGLSPTIAVPLTDESKGKGIDTQLNRAIEYLQTGK